MRRRGRRRRGQAAAAAGCQMPPNWPDPRRGVDALKYVGERITGRFGNRGIYTLQDLIDHVNGHTLAQNRRMMHYVMLNARNMRCVFRSESRNHRTETKNWPNPWPNPPYNLPNAPASRPGLVPGDFEYCVREYNKCGWEVVEAFLRQRGDVDQARIPPSPDRDNYCRPRRRTDPGPDWCLRQARQQSSSEEEGEDEEEEGSGGVGDQFVEADDEDSMERNVRQFREERGIDDEGGMDMGGDYFEEEEEEEVGGQGEEDDDDGRLEEVVLWREGDPDPWQAFDIHAILRRERDAAAQEARDTRERLQRRFATDLSDLDTAQRIAYVIWSLSTARDQAAPSVNVLAELAGVSATAARRAINANLDDEGYHYFTRPRRGRYALIDGLFSGRERTFLRRIGA